MTETNRCSVCLGGIFEKQTARGPCGHVWHAPCIRQWLNDKPTCPECKRPVRQQDLVIPAVVLAQEDKWYLKTTLTKEETLVQVAEMREKLGRLQRRAPEVKKELEGVQERLETAKQQMEKLTIEEKEKKFRVTKTLPETLQTLQTELDELRSRSQQQVRHGLSLFPRGKIDVTSAGPVVAKRANYPEFFRRVRLMWEGLVTDERKADLEIKKLNRKINIDKEERKNLEEEINIFNLPKKRKVDLYEPSFIKPREFRAEDVVPSLPRKFSRPGENDAEVVTKDHVIKENRAYDNLFNRREADKLIMEENLEDEHIEEERSEKFSEIIDLSSP